MKTSYDVIVAPLITEKLARLAEGGNVVVFKVHPGANKIQIRAAIEEIWKVDVVRVRTINYEGKLKRMGRFVGRRSNWKKAVVTLADGQSIPDLTA
jgi:large subunit ribosomal protein L23